MPRQKITEPADEALVNLTEQQLKFVEGILAGMKPGAAYRAAYDCSGYTNPNSIAVEASRLRNHPEIALTIAEARTKRVTLGYAEHDQNLERLSRVAEREGNLGAAVAAEQLRGKAAGLYIEQIRDVTEHDPIETLRSIAAIAGNETAEKLALANGIPWVAPAQPDRKSLN